jgi:hypothetical protein
VDLLFLIGGTMGLFAVKEPIIGGHRRDDINPVPLKGVTTMLRSLLKIK